MRNWFFRPSRAIKVMNILMVLTGLAIAGSIAFTVTAFILARRASEGAPTEGLIKFMLRLETGLEILAIVIGVAAILALAALIITFVKYRRAGRQRGRRGFNDLN